MNIYVNLHFYLHYSEVVNAYISILFITYIKYECCNIGSCNNNIINPDHLVQIVVSTDQHHDEHLQPASSPQPESAPPTWAATPTWSALHPLNQHATSVTAPPIWRWLPVNAFQVF